MGLGFSNVAKSFSGKAVGKPNVLASRKLISAESGPEIQFNTWKTGSYTLGEALVNSGTAAGTGTIQTDTTVSSVGDGSSLLLEVFDYIELENPTDFALNSIDQSQTVYMDFLDNDGVYSRNDVWFWLYTDDATVGPSVGGSTTNDRYNGIQSYEPDAIRAGLGNNLTSSGRIFADFYIERTKLAVTTSYDPINSRWDHKIFINGVLESTLHTSDADYAMTDSGNEAAVIGAVRTLTGGKSIRLFEYRLYSPGISDTGAESITTKLPL